MKWDFIYYQCTKACNLHCPYCYDWKTPEKIRLTSQDIRDYFRFETKRLVLTGGEPTIRDDIAEVVNALLKTINLERLIICSNFHFPEKLIEILEHNSGLIPKMKGIEFITSFDSPIQEMHDKIRGRGAFQKTIQTIQTLKSYRERFPNFSVGSNVCITPTNYQDIYKTFLLAEKLDIKFNYCFPHPFGREDMIWTDEMFYALKAQFEMMDMYDPIKFQIFKNQRRTIPCNAGKKWFVIRPDGKIGFCWDYNTDLNLKINKMAEIEKKLSKFNPKGCIRCEEYNGFHSFFK